ncbi:anaphase promoting complex subunit cdc16 [Blyttiomyces sp. JEL0837]|nr:anaphase promoting complex subunit cdc16 [Blyttiomyces sp. JEL0837]
MQPFDKSPLDRQQAGFQHDHVPQKISGQQKRKSKAIAPSILTDLTDKAFQIQKTELNQLQRMPASSSSSAPATRTSSRRGGTAPSSVSAGTGRILDVPPPSMSTRSTRGSATTASSTTTASGNLASTSAQPLRQTRSQRSKASSSSGSGSTSTAMTGVSSSAGTNSNNNNNMGFGTTATGRQTKSVSHPQQQQQQSQTHHPPGNNASGGGSNTPFGDDSAGFTAGEDDGHRNAGKGTTKMMGVGTVAGAPGASALGSTAGKAPLTTSGNAKGLGSGHAGVRGSRVERIRAWVHMALEMNLYNTALFWGDKLISFSGDIRDVFCFAKALFYTEQYSRAVGLLLAQTNIDGPCRCLVAQCNIKMGKIEEALDYMRDSDNGRQPDVGTTNGGIKLESILKYFEGMCHMKLKDFGTARKLFQESLVLDCRCYEAFHILITHHMLTIDEEIKLLASLQYLQQCGEEHELVRSLYSISIKKYNRYREVETYINILETNYNLAYNPTILLSKAELHYNRCQFDESLRHSTIILERDPLNLECMWIHVANLYELDRRSDLFLLAHELVEKHPTQPVAWYAVGTYYLLMNNPVESSKYFSKATKLDGECPAAWIGFAHALELEGSSDQAISVYSQAAKLGKGTHLPTLYIGMQHIQAGHGKLGEEYVKTAKFICGMDPLVENELGVAAYQRKDYKAAITYFENALELSKPHFYNSQTWHVTWSNLGHCYRKLGKVISASATNGPAFAALGVTEYQMGNLEEAIINLHEALALDPNDSCSREVLRLALEENSKSSFTFPTFWTEPDQNYDFDDDFFVPPKSSAKADPSVPESTDTPMQDAKPETSDGATNVKGKGKAPLVESSITPPLRSVFNDTVEPPALDNTIHSKIRAGFAMADYHLHDDSDSDRGVPIQPPKKGLLFGIRKTASDVSTEQLPSLARLQERVAAATSPVSISSPAPSTSNTSNTLLEPGAGFTFPLPGTVETESDGIRQIPKASIQTPSVGTSEQHEDDESTPSFGRQLRSRKVSATATKTSEALGRRGGSSKLTMVIDSASTGPSTSLYSDSGNHNGNNYNSIGNGSGSIEEEQDNDVDMEVD